MTIDWIDCEILKVLKDDARQPNSVIARIVSVSETTIRRRIKSMIGEGTVAIRSVGVDFS